MKNGNIIHLICFCIFNSSFYSSAQTWLQKGTNIYGQAALDYFGQSVSINADGSVIAVGAIGNDQAGSNAGSLRVFYWSGTNWIQKGSDILGDASDDSVGSSVSLSSDGNTIAVGIPGSDIISSAGTTKIYEWNGVTWLLKGLPIVGETINNYSGRSVSLSADGNRVVIGARYNSDNGTSSGQVRVYDWDGSSWMQAGQDLDGDNVQDWFGEPVVLSADGNIIAVGAQQIFGSGTNSGYVKIFEWTGTVWSQKGATIFGTGNYDNSGRSIAMSFSGDTLAVGAANNDDNGFDAGQVRTFFWDGSNWSMLATVQLGENTDDLFGVSVSMNYAGTILSVGATGYNNDSGKLSVYELDGANWILKGNTLLGTAAADYFGLNQVSSTGNELIASAGGNNFFANDAGMIQVYEFCAPTYSTQFINDCDSYTVPSGNETHIVSGNYSDIIPNAKGCDSLITINLNLNYSSSSTINPIACFSYNSPAGNVYASSGTYTEVLTNSAGCDSVMTIQLVINTISATVQVFSDSLFAMPAAASYQWLDCGTNEIIPFETNQFFSPTIAGDYAAVLTSSSGCVDTSSCQPLNLAAPVLDDKQLQIFPNPAEGYVVISCVTETATLTIFDLLGNSVHQSVLQAGSSQISIDQLPAGSYILQVQQGGSISNFHLAKK